MLCKLFFALRRSNALLDLKEKRIAVLLYLSWSMWRAHTLIFDGYARMHAGDSEITVFKNVLRSTVPYPEHFSADVCNLLDGLLDRNPGTRIPCGKGGCMALKNHAFFQGISWEHLAKKEVMPPASLMERLEQCALLPPVAINHRLTSGNRPSWMDDF
jgi:hypothetical protein